MLGFEPRISDIEATTLPSAPQLQPLNNVLKNNSSFWTALIYMFIVRPYQSLSTNLNRGSAFIFLHFRQLTKMAALPQQNGLVS